jgi:hypothetical protein
MAQRANNKAHQAIAGKARVRASGVAERPKLPTKPHVCCLELPMCFCDSPRPAAFNKAARICSVVRSDPR